MDNDILIENHGSIATLTPITEAGREWVKDNVSYEDWQVMGCSISIEPRCIPDIIVGIQDAGLTAG